jgi:parvulin-like peptidyl-prolyl isomerase
MKSLILLACAVCACAAAQDAQSGVQIPVPPPPPKGDQVVVTIEGKPWTKDEIEKFIRSLSPNVMNNFYANKKVFLEQLALMMRLSKMAEESGLDRQDPHSQRLYYNRLQYLSTALMTREGNLHVISPEEVKAHYERRRDQFLRAKTRIVYVSFSTVQIEGAKGRTEEEAQARAAEVAAKARAGADFTALAKDFSDDADSREKGGEFPPIRPTDKTVPDNIRAAVFALRPGQVSDPVRMPNGFYVFRLEEFTAPEFTEVSQEIFDSLKQERFAAWMAGVQKSLKIEFNDPAYLTEPMQR